MMSVLLSRTIQQACAKRHAVGRLNFPGMGLMERGTNALFAEGDTGRMIIAAGPTNHAKIIMEDRRTLLLYVIVERAFL